MRECYTCPIPHTPAPTLKEKCCENVGLGDNQHLYSAFHVVHHAFMIFPICILSAPFDFLSPPCSRQGWSWDSSLWVTENSSTCICLACSVHTQCMNRKKGTGRYSVYGLYGKLGLRFCIWSVLMLCLLAPCSSESVRTEKISLLLRIISEMETSHQQGLLPTPPLLVRAPVLWRHPKTPKQHPLSSTEGNNTLCLCVTGSSKYFTTGLSPSAWGGNSVIAPLQGGHVDSSNPLKWLSSRPPSNHCEIPK